MSEELTRFERVAIGQRAERLTDELREHIVAVEQGYIRQWTGAQTTEEREALWHRQQALRDVASDLIARVGDGKIAQEEIDNGYE
jgi:hypothetical protein